MPASMVQVKIEQPCPCHVDVTGLQENLYVNVGNINPVLTNQIAWIWATIV